MDGCERVNQAGSPSAMALAWISTCVRDRSRNDQTSSVVVRRRHDCADHDRRPPARSRIAGACHDSCNDRCGNLESMSEPLTETLARFAEDAEFYRWKERRTAECR